MNIVFITSTALRHKYLAHALAKALHVVGIVSEGKPKKITDTSSYDAQGKQIVDAHFALRTQREEEFFGAYRAFPDVPLLEVPFRGSNTPETFGWVKERNPDLVMLFGSSIIKDPLLSYYDGKMVNIHLGLSPYYKGSATNFWPLVEGEPECVGATIHLAVPQVDAGPILHQFRPDVMPDDDPHSLGCRVIEKAGVVLPHVLTAYAQGSLVSVKQDIAEGKEYRIKDFSPADVKTAWEHIDAGMFATYIAHKKKRDAQKPIVAGIDIV